MNGNGLNMVFKMIKLTSKAVSFHISNLKDFYMFIIEDYDGLNFYYFCINFNILYKII